MRRKFSASTPNSPKAMRTPAKTPSKLQPLGISLARFRSAAAIVAALLAAAQSTQAVGIWDGGGDGFSWTDPLNWDTDTVPTAGDIVNFASVPPATAILLLGSQTANALNFTQSYTLGAYGTNQVLTDTTGNISVTGGNFATMNASYGGTAGLSLSGGGTLFLNNPAPTFAGNITVDGAGTTLLHRQEGPTVQYNGVGGAQEFGRFDQASQIGRAHV